MNRENFTYFIVRMADNNNNYNTNDLSQFPLDYVKEDSLHTGEGWVRFNHSCSTFETLLSLRV